MSAPKNWRFVRVLLYTGSGFTGCQTCPVAAGLRFREKNQDSGDTCVASALVLGCVRPGSIAWFYCLVLLPGSIATGVLPRRQYHGAIADGAVARLVMQPVIPVNLSESCVDNYNITLIP